MTVAFLGLGSNLGDRAGNLRAAPVLLEAAGIRVVARSSIWESVPVPADQPAFLNAVIAVDVALAAHELLAVTQSCERQRGRRRGRRWGPRPLDVDILLFGETTVSRPDLVIPHPLLEERPFVLAPLLEVLPPGAPGRCRFLGRLDAIGPVGLFRTSLGWGMP